MILNSNENVQNETDKETGRIILYLRENGFQLQTSLDAKKTLELLCTAVNLCGHVVVSAAEEHGLKRDEISNALLRFLLYHCQDFLPSDLVKVMGIGKGGCDCEFCKGSQKNAPGGPKA